MFKAATVRERMGSCQTHGMCTLVTTRLLTRGSGRRGQRSAVSFSRITPANGQNAITSWRRIVLKEDRRPEAYILYWGLGNWARISPKRKPF